MNRNLVLVITFIGYRVKQQQLDDDVINVIVIIFMIFANKPITT